MSNSLVEHFSELPDPRVRGRTDYPLIEIVFLCISAIISGYDGWGAIEDFGHGKLNWLRKFLPYTNGIPRHDTVARVMSCLSPKALQSCFVSWVQSIAVIDQLKSICHIEHSRHRSPLNFLVNLVGGLAAYCVRPRKPAIKMDRLPQSLNALIHN